MKSRSSASRFSSSFAAGGAKKVQKTQTDGWQMTPTKGRAVTAATPVAAPKKVHFQASRFAAFDTDSDEEVEHIVIPAETPEEFFARIQREDPFVLALARGLSWFEATHGEDDPVIKASQVRIKAENEARAALFAAIPEPSAPPATEEELEAHYMAHCQYTEEEFWTQPFAEKIEERIPDYFDTSLLTDDEFHSMLSWAYNKGWIVDVCGRETVKLQSDDGPSRRYIPTNFWEQNHCCSDKPKKTSTIPRFCREANCQDLDCRYVHGDTIPKVNRDCSFGAECGKRSQCLYMHPGERWTTSSCIHRSK
jgi:hypothetical protein